MSNKNATKNQLLNEKMHEILRVAAILFIYGLTVLTIYQFLNGDARHPLSYISQCISIVSPGVHFDPFGKSPTFDTYGLWVVFAWSFYYLSGLMCYLLAPAILIMTAEYLCHIIDKGNSNVHDT